MKLDRILWGILLLFVGGVLLLENFNVIDFYWRNIWSFFPVFLIILGVNILFNRNNSQTGSLISIGILVVALGFLFVKGQEVPQRTSWWRNWNGRDGVHIDIDDDRDNSKYPTKHFGEQLLPGDELKKAVLNLSGGGVTFDLKNTTDSLFSADVERSRGEFSLIKMSEDSTNTLTFKMRDKKNWSGNGRDVDMRLNTKPVWEMNLKLGAAEVDFDLTPYKVRTLNFDGGAADVDIKIGSLMPITDVNVKTGIADVKIKVPRGPACRIKTKTGLSSREFDGFEKVSDGLYETSNFNSTAQKIFINFDGGLSSFEVSRY